MAERVVNVAQVSDESGVGQGLAAALGDRARVVFVPVRQAGSRWNPLLKPMAFLPRYLDARKTRLRIDSLIPRPDVMHIHWLPNGLIGTALPRSTRIPWVLHIHGSDIRGVRGWRLAGYRRLLHAADAVVFSTPDLATDVQRWRPDAQHLPAPIAIGPVKSEAVRDVFAASAALSIKGADMSFAALRLIAAAEPGVRIAAMSGQAFEAGPWERLDFVAHDTFIRRLASSRVIIGQLKLGIVSVVELESMAIGKPVVGWIDERLYPDAPPIISASGPSAVAQAVTGLLGDPHRLEELGWDGAAWVRTHHDPERIAQQLLAIYRRVIATAK
ncbi:MAG: glycosyltransferase family 4 protein [Chloroflexi bacterium]|nr:glycosyltransferase family 4 protein [Chloroflexota bacterium]